MIEVKYFPTPNGHKVTILLEECGLPYRLSVVDITKGQQFAADFLVVAPNNRIPAIVDHAPADGGAPVGVFESGAILLYLARKTGKFMPTDPRGEAETMQWVFWQMSALGPMSGQFSHFDHIAPERLPYAIERYRNEVNRLYGVLDRRLADRPYVADDTYSIADMACYPWMLAPEKRGQTLDAFANIRRWVSVVGARPAVARAYAAGQAIHNTHVPPPEARRFLYGLTAQGVREIAGT